MSPNFSGGGGSRGSKRAIFSNLFLLKMTFPNLRFLPVCLPKKASKGFRVPNLGLRVPNPRKHPVFTDFFCRVRSVTKGSTIHLKLTSFSRKNRHIHNGSRVCLFGALLQWGRGGCSSEMQA